MSGTYSALAEQRIRLHTLFLKMKGEIEALCPEGGHKELALDRLLDSFAWCEIAISRGSQHDEPMLHREKGRDN